VATILVIDDQTEAREALRRILVADGHVVLEAADGLEAVKLLDDAAADLVFTDIYMPEMDGIEFLTWVTERAPEIPVIAMSGGGLASSASVLGDAHELGATGVVEKPFEPERVRDIVRRYLRHDSGPGPDPI
jgi:DNA-binding NtrC family response regulator